MITGGSLLFRGTSLLEASLKATATFAVLYAAQKILGGVLESVATSEPPAGPEAETKIVDS
ncbi:MAG: hypothetical protein ACYC2Y_04285 [Armatimonadota bacterium]